MRNSISTPFQSFRARLLLLHCKARRTQHYHNQFRDFSCIAARRSHIQGDGSSRHLYEPIEGVEKLESYRAGGYHTITIGDRIHSRYQVVQKLGHGTYSTIWLARDQKHNRYVAIKVCTADSNPLEFTVLRNFPTRNKAQKPA
jgi:hypothetical protein